MELINLLGIVVPAPIPFLPRRTGNLFSDHVRQARQEEDADKEA